MKFKKLPILCLTLLLSLFLSTSASAASVFSDVPADSIYYEAVTYLAEHGIAVGSGNQCFSPEAPITVRQWAVMLCRAYEQPDVLADTSGAFGDACILRCYREYWLSESALESPDSRMCRSALLQSAFRAAGLPIYDYALYPNGVELSAFDNILRVGKELGLCPAESSALDLMTRGDAAKVLFLLLTHEYEVEAPPMVSAAFLYNPEGVALNPYLLELDQLPQTILQAFARRGWSYRIDFSYLENFSQQRGMDCIGVTIYNSKQIWVSDHTATIHEFGHFLDQVLNFPQKHTALFRAEAQAAAAVLQDYAATDSREYFAEYFAFWIENHENERKMEQLRTVSPETYEYFLSLEAGGWVTDRAS